MQGPHPRIGILNTPALIVPFREYLFKTVSGLLCRLGYCRMSHGLNVRIVPCAFNIGHERNDLISLACHATTARVW